ncbi:hypothetical protein [Chitinophaga nivalis]|uniref:Uncharacterized protein n=1 Tax=Chitinophaga nivalis TaxID=2991709 RepID=A0ABT3IF22_9BACT|nr:hypothetical protein [Chitinophaga nivalis]MCW3467754.1 hypothetical protein [Chitinophaga nivalis]MCW3482554.1 hypothetical protein [Chitinophaga nivalis]
MSKKFLVEVTSQHPSSKGKLLLSILGEEPNDAAIFDTLPGVNRKRRGPYHYELRFGYTSSNADVLGYKAKYLRTTDQLKECIKVLAAQVS